MSGTDRGRGRQQKGGRGRRRCARRGRSIDGLARAPPPSSERGHTVAVRISSSQLLSVVHCAPGVGAIDCVRQVT
eukprot:scaffold37404_cov28-Tisochrysis_lutea.AAC.1